MTVTEIQTARWIKSAELKKLRLKTGLSKNQVSIETGLNRVTIDRMESGSACWNIDSEIIYTTFLLSFQK